MLPSLGRIVLYTHAAETLDFRQMRPGTFPAIVTGVHDGEVLDLTLFPPGRAAVPLRKIPPAPEGQSQAEHWHWPPRV